MTSILKLTPWLASCTIFAVLACHHPKTIATDNRDGGSDSEGECGVPDVYAWTSTSAIIEPPEGVLAVKDPSVLYDNGSWHVYATTKTDVDNDWSMVYLNFADWSDAGSAPKTMVAEVNANLDGYKTSPQFFYFEPQGLWYLIYQKPEPAYSTTDDPGDVASWSATAEFMSDQPDGALDYWMICDDTDCYLFFTDLKGVFYRARTSKESFPNGFEGTTEIVMEFENEDDFFQGVNVYKIEGTDQYLLIVSAMHQNPYYRYFRSFTADRLDGTWTAQPSDNEDDGWFASVNNVTGGDWAQDGFNAGEMLRYNRDETLTIDTCRMQYLYHGKTADGGSGTDLNEYALGLLTDAR